MEPSGRTNEFFPTSTPEEQGMDGATLARFRAQLNRNKINSCLIIRHGRCVFEHYRNNKIKSKPRNVHSVTKSIISALVGICLEQGLLPSLDTPILEFFPSMAQNESDPRKRAITVEHLLTMTPGYHWPEWSEWEGFAPMYFAPNWVRFVLERPLEYDPGERMNYNTGATQVLTAIVQQVSGMKASAFADKHLFQPLGITEYLWREDPQGINDGGSGLALTPLDMAKFGYLYLHAGRWGKQQLLSKEWVAYSTTPRYLTYEKHGHYARHWWVGALDPAQELDGTNRFHAALGHGGQYILVIPSANMVVAITSEMPEQALLPLRLFREYIVPALGVTAREHLAK